MKLSKERIGEQKGENIIIVICMIVIVVLSFVVIGWSSIKSWLSTPLIWKGQDSLEVYYFGTLPNKNSKEDYNIILGISNNTNEEIDEYSITFNVEGVKFDYLSYSHSDISAYGMTDATLSITTSEYSSPGEKRVSEKTLEKLLNSKETDSIKISCRIKSLKSHGETLVNNTGIYKDILIVILSIFMGIIGFFGDIRAAWLRILLKMFALPAIFFAVVALVLIAMFANSDSADSMAAANDAAKKSAAENYKREANLKAGAVAHGNQREAAFAQARMDKSMADMVGGDPSARNEYKRQAQLKAGFIAHGNTKEAAKCQAAMDRLMADMIKNK